ncbi:rhomboid family intramembrane serine protease [Lacihabitans sp. CCS-44]|uniref:rhomboid family intramembrane serine protease n=1 Tax=Lacihabitans sp. CCS-44 TaxID=2487331 RepID=UPI0020CC0D00|nr:rhomboid family intramembrane serine protease [Lacihabitans sp. CCS-44]MCP9757595.1 rhomboid family intramembrane serine protease [Lacihabitans sp. CCS-44]
MRSVFSDILNAFRKNNNQIIQLVLINAFVFLSIALLKFSFRFFADPNFYVEFVQKNIYLNSSFLELIRRPWTLLMFPFTNASILDVLFNGLALFWFGSILVDFLGGRKTIIIYITGAIFSVFFYLGIWTVLNILNRNTANPSVLYGASAGIYAVMFAAVALLPEYELMFFRFFIKLRIVAIVFLVLSLLLNPHAGVLNLGAATFGYLQVKFLRTGLNITQPIENFFVWVSKLKQPQKKVIIKKYSSVGEYSSRHFFDDTNVPNQEEVDFLLDKINKGGGYESLTKEEKNRLYKASQRKD